MNPIALSNKTTKIIAHRGLSGLETENTCAAFVAAGNRSYFGIETDIHLTTDGFFAVIHDDRTGRVSPTDLVVEQSTMEQLASLVLYDKHNPKTMRSDLRIPTVQEYLSVCRYYEKTAVLELKNPMPLEAIKNLVSVVQKQSFIDETIFISFHYENLLYLRSVFPQCHVQFLTSEWSEDVVRELGQQKMGLDIHYGCLNEYRVAFAHDMGVEVNCWTCDSEAEAYRLMDMGVDYITSNILE